MGVVSRMKNFILLHIYGEQYKIQENINRIIKNGGNNVQCIIAKIQRYYNKNNYSLDELVSRKFRLENIGVLEKNIMIPMFVSFISSIIFYLSSFIEKLNAFKEYYNKNEYINFIIIKNSLLIISVIVLAMASIIIASQVFLYCLYYIPSKKRSKKSYIFQMELAIIEKEIDKKRNYACAQHKTKKCCQM